MKKLMLILLILLFVSQVLSQEKTKFSNLYLLAPGAGLVFVGIAELNDAHKQLNEVNGDSDIMIVGKQVAGVALITVGSYLIIKALTPVSVEKRIEISATNQKVNISLRL